VEARVSSHVELAPRTTRASHDAAPLLLVAEAVAQRSGNPVRQSVMG
jgi:hypothetical protein